MPENLSQPNKILSTIEIIAYILLGLLNISFMTIIILVICLLKILTKQITWKNLGFQKTNTIGNILLWGVIIAIIYQTLSITMFVPIISRITGNNIDLSEIQALKGSWVNLVIALIISWTFAAFGEEIVYRSYLYSTIENIFSNKWFGYIIGILVCTIMFAVGHGYQGISGIIENIIFGLVLSICFLLSNKNLWYPIIIHGMVDTIGFVLILSGLYP